MIIESGGRAIAIEHRGGDITYVSHAHSDHAVRTGSILSSRETYALLTSGRKRPRNSSWSEGIDGVKLYNAGHMLGATQMMAENGKTIVHTGDLRLRDGFTTKAAPILQCDTLYIDTTFSEPCFTFPDKHEISDQILEWVAEKRKKGSIVFGAYRLGKAQELIVLLNEAGIIPFVEPSIEEYCQVYENHGVKLERICISEDYCNHIPLGQFATAPDAKDITEEKDAAEAKNGKAESILPATASTSRAAGDGGSFVAVYPFHQVKNHTVNLNALKAATGNAFDVLYPALATGWALKYDFRMPAFPLSDHCGFDEILRYAKESGASKVVCMYSSTGEIVRELRRQGINARLSSC